ncbi:Powdery mildew resistance protein RPW8 domain [Arabidopsis suecica]|uniref:Protein RESISTANCE TO POWDERY MILDEW 8.1 n=4 Tax=Arabidopsis TaxID=3701 RepID=RPW81_ARATH|nr:RecName: Full=Protein RESISTANCE TO POWDERY MILDEW 8.1; Short=AtRPW8.1 [Arabidopsis thaliana]KAG7633923.1 Powdery mildew resistance protein RPW8 domain [Arabidopsis suecica]AAK09266.1 RPW8.1 [Arabidopsis thaliana]ACJ05898.1 RPW8.1 [Arabidopsis thaliana]ACJ05899.1 RPW8.1 [Arabidopsis thaliana]QDK56864.1 RPW8.1a [Arabidopsis thaliana]
MPIGELAIGAVLGVGAQAIYDRFRKARDISFVHRLCATILSIEPFLVQIDKRSKVEGSPLREVNERLTCFLELAYVFVEAYPKLRRRQVLRKYRYIKAIETIELALRSIIVVDFQVDQWDDIKEIKAKISEMDTKLAEVISACSKIRA